LAIQSQPAAPIRRTIIFACCVRSGDPEKAAQERAVLDGFAPDFIASLFRGENRVFTRPEDMEHLLEGLRLTAGGATFSTVAERQESAPSRHRPAQSTTGRRSP
jgi:hypothetical protein